MKLLTVTTLASILALGLCVGLLRGKALQLEEGGLTISGAVLRPGSRERVPGAEVLISEGRGLGNEVKAILKTDSEGQFRLTGLEPGEYDVSPVIREAAGTTAVSPARTETVRLRAGEIPPSLVVWLPLRASISGRVTAPDGEPMPDMEVSLWRLGWNGQPTLIPALDRLKGPRTDEEGRYKLSASTGEYYVEVRHVPPGIYPRHYYPGVLYPEEAAPVTLRAGTDLSGVDVSIGDTELYRVRFSMDLPPLQGMTAPPSAYLANDAVPVGAIIQPVGLGRIRTGRLPYGVNLRPIDRSTWEFEQLLGPGEYELSLSYDYIALLGKPRFRAELQGLGFHPDLYTQPFRIVDTRITVNPDDADETGHVDLGTIPVPSRVSVAGRVVVRPLAGGAIDITGLQLTMASDIIKADGTFLLKDFPPGRYTFGFAPASIPNGWYVESVRSGGRDVLRDGLELTGQQAPIQVVIAEGTGQIVGTARSDGGELIPGARIVLIPPREKQGWQARFPTTVANAAGTWVLESIPPGDYRLVALDEAGTVAPAQPPLPSDLYWESPEFLNQSELRGERITVDPGARMTINAEALPIYD